jgi:hypothetical protein
MFLFWEEKTQNILKNIKTIFTFLLQLLILEHAAVALWEGSWTHCWSHKVRVPVCQMITWLPSLASTLMVLYSLPQPHWVSPMTQLKEGKWYLGDVLPPQQTDLIKNKKKLIRHQKLFLIKKNPFKWKVSGKGRLVCPCPSLLLEESLCCHLCSEICQRIELSAPKAKNPTSTIGELSPWFMIFLVPQLFWQLGCYKDW